MKRLLISMSGGIIITLSPALVGALIVNRGIWMGFVAFLLGGPMFLIEKLGVGPDCANADLIAEKMRCLQIALMVDLAAYPLTISACSYLIYLTLFGRKRRGRLP